MEALADAVGLRALGFGPRVVDILHRYVELVSEYCGNPERHGRPSAEPVDDSHHGIQGIEEAEAFRNDAALKSDRGDIQAELNDEGDNKAKIPVLDHEGGDP